MMNKIKIGDIVVVDRINIFRSLGIVTSGATINDIDGYDVLILYNYFVEVIDYFPSLGETISVVESEVFKTH